jgi:hypothetical protein
VSVSSEALKRGVLVVALWGVPTSPPRGEGWSHDESHWEADLAAGTSGPRGWRARSARMWRGLCCLLWGSPGGYSTVVGHHHDVGWFNPVSRHCDWSAVHADE